MAVRALLQRLSYHRLGELCAGAGLPQGGPAVTRENRLCRHYEGRLAELIEELRRDELCEFLQFSEFQLRGQAFNLSPCSEARRDELSRIVMALFVDGVRDVREGAVVVEGGVVEFGLLDRADLVDEDIDALIDVLGLQPRIDPVAPAGDQQERLAQAEAVNRQLLATIRTLTDEVERLRREVERLRRK